MNEEEAFEAGRKAGFQEGVADEQKQQHIGLEKKIEEKYELAYARVIRMLCEELEKLDPQNPSRLSDVYKRADETDAEWVNE